MIEITRVAATRLGVAVGKKKHDLGSYAQKSRHQIAYGHIQKPFIFIIPRVFVVSPVGFSRNQQLE